MPKSKKIYSIEDIKNIIHSHEAVLQDKYKTVKFYLFGSYARGEQTAKSDIDLLVELEESISMFKFLDLEEDLEKIFGKKIDLGTPDSLKPYIKDSILKESITL
ncbi:MAG: hypothetical protein A2104_04080 [Candidatus Melainabacteria bacterium GWF2_32_7]|nr:MAG: hypothetical protein A2104_04080 [Candidatus Melainabacteria bacterium GWF2_32_7]